MAYVPVWKPATPAEAHTMYLEAAGSSRERAMPVIVRMRTHVYHQKQKVAFGS